MEQGKESSPSSVAETTCDKLTITLIPPLPAPLGKERELGRKEGWVNVFSRYYFTSHYPALILLVINSINICNSSQFPRDVIW